MSKRKSDALAILLSTYLDDEDESDDSSEEDDKQTSEQLQEDKLENTTKRVRKHSDEDPDGGHANDNVTTSLPLPEGIRNMFNDEDDSKTKLDCDGRIRSFEHFPGNWALHTYIAYPDRAAMSHIIDALVHSVSTSTAMHRFPLTDLHVSLSRTVPVRHYWIEPITEQLKEFLASKEGFTCIIEKPELYVNDEKTRSFLGLKISTGTEQLQRLSSGVDQIFNGFSLSKFYKNPSFHVSVAWCLGDIFNQITKDDKGKLQAAFDSTITEKTSKLLVFDVKEVKCKIGNKLFSFSL